MKTTIMFFLIYKTRMIGFVVAFVRVCVVVKLGGGSAGRVGVE